MAILDFGYGFIILCCLIRSTFYMHILHTQKQIKIELFIYFLLQIIPRNLTFAHAAKVTALAKATDGWDNQSSIISAADNGLG